ncbi:MAG: retroviral-like aspartic protease family protein [Alphaproteobacteria bacterium]|nr:retroviral-like aspartic protease family protein [Alphaproteobacteria bacterium]
MPASLPLVPIVVAAGAVLLLALLTRVPFLGAAIRVAISLALVALVVLMVTERAPLSPFLGSVADTLHLDEQEVAGKEVRIRMAPNGHFFATVTMNGVRRRMLVDSGATVTAISTETAAEAGLKPDLDPVPVVLQTANGTVAAKTSTVPELRLGAIVARNLKVVVSPAFGDMDVIGMNFLSKLASWRVEGKTLILVPHHPQPVKA